MEALYGADLAYVHEAGFSDLALAAAREVRQRVRPPTLVTDLGCGGGTLAQELTRFGYRVVGCDLSPAMVDLARRRVPGGTFEVADGLAFGVPPCGVVTAVGEVLNYALADRPPGDISPFLRRVHDALRPGGVLLFDVATTGKAQGDRKVVRLGADWRVEARIQVEGDNLTRTLDTWRTVAGNERHSREVHRQRLLDPPWLEAELAAAGFTVNRTGAYDDHMLQEGWDVFVGTSQG